MHDRIHPAEPCDSLAQDRVDRVAVGHIRDDHQGGCADIPTLRLGGGQAFRRARDQDDVGAPGCEQPGRGPTDAAGRAGDDDGGPSHAASPFGGNSGRSCHGTWEPGQGHFCRSWPRAWHPIPAGTVKL